MHNFQELKIWQKSMDVTEQTYRLSAEFPKKEKYGLTSQIRRSAVSIPSNIAEGAGRNTNGVQKLFGYCKQFFKRTFYTTNPFSSIGISFRRYSKTYFK